METKVCSQCREAKPVTDFYERKPVGQKKYRSECKACGYEQWKRWRSRPGNREKKKVWLRRYYLQHHEEALEKRRAYHREYYLRNRETLYRKHRIYETSPHGREVSREGSKRRRARVRGATMTPNVLTPEQWTLLLERFCYSCAWCGTTFSDRNRPEQDHLVPVSKGGQHTVENIVPACKSCNARWGNKPKPQLSSMTSFRGNGTY